MIVKMKFINISGPKADLDRVVSSYLSKYEIQLEHAITELRTTENLLPFVDLNPYKDPLAKLNKFLEYLTNSTVHPDTTLETDEIIDLIRECNQTHLNLSEKLDLLKKSKDNLQDHLKIISPFHSLDFDLNQVQKYSYIKARFGRIPIDFYKKLEKYLYDTLGVIFIEGGRDSNYVYGSYFVANTDAFQSDGALKALHFENIALPDETYGTPLEASHKLEEDIAKLENQILEIESEISEIFLSRADKIIGSKQKLEELSQNFEVRKLGARIQHEEEEFYILCGWIAEKEADNFIAETKNDEDIMVVIEENRAEHFGKPPTKLKNPRLFKPFELFIQMYGLPDHNEMDPTIFVALTYILIFGFMFGDVGQGLCLVLIGSLIYFAKKAPLAGIIALAGVFSTFFGFMFGSIFGFEEIIEAHWIRPIAHMTTLPFIGKLNTVFIVSVAFGMTIILLSMLFHILNAIRARDIGSTWFDANGVAGLVFYGSAVAAILLFMTGRRLPGGILLATMFGMPLLIIALKEPITKRLEKSSKKSEGGKGLFVIQTFFELFEILLSYFSNTLSFVRIGAFAVSHAAMMQVVLMLAGAESDNINWITVILGNIFVCALEGLVVGIQVLRLEYYEMFSRFYGGSGRAFKPYKTKKMKSKEKHNPKEA
jgi:Archaeal/vacuolar-type H+-ATPase subunit I